MMLGRLRSEVAGARQMAESVAEQWSESVELAGDEEEALRGEEDAVVDAGSALVGQMVQSGVVGSREEVDALLGAEDTYSRAVRDLARVLFADHEAIGASGRAGYAAITDPRAVIASRSSQESYQADMAELARLRDAYPLSMNRWVDAHARVARARAMLASLSGEDTSEEEGEGGRGGEERGGSVKAQIQYLIESALPRLFGKLGEEVAQPILHDDYDHKIARLRSRRERQERVLSKIKAQSARLEELNTVLEDELESMARGIAPLEEYMGQIQDQIKRIHASNRVMDHLAEQATGIQARALRSSGFVEGENTVLRDAAAVLGLDPRLGVESVVSATQRLVDHVRKQESYIASSFEEVEDKVHELGAVVGRAESMLYGYGKGEAVVLTPPELARKMEVLSARLGELGEGLNGIVGKRRIRGGGEEEEYARRGLWVDFYVDPGRVVEKGRTIAPPLTSAPDIAPPVAEPDIAPP